jgi:ABC-type nitrate/sulfonate/bicarbonate transport system ATPase subunit
MKKIPVRTNTVCKGFGSGESRTEVLKEVTFEAYMGELLMLVGPSGGGKTTLLSVIAGTLATDHGEVEVFNSTASAPRQPSCSPRPSVAAGSARPHPAWRCRSNH